MHMQLNEESGGKVLAIYISSKLIKEDYADLVPDIERLAMVGENKWQQCMTLFCKPFTKAMVRYFDHADAAKARKWLDEI